MGRPYANEIAEMSAVYHWALQADIASLTEAILRSSHSPLVAVASGGALTTAQYLVQLQQHFAETLAISSTPLRITDHLPSDRNIALWLISARGRNKDIRTAYSTAIAREPKLMTIVCGARSSPLVAAARFSNWVDTIAYDLPTRDGFLATGSTLAFGTLLARGFHAAYRTGRNIPGSLEALIQQHAPSVAQWSTLKEACHPLLKRPTILVVHGASLTSAALDLESRFTESAIGNTQIADYRNFAHGRHHWLAKHEHSSAVLALVGPDEVALAERTLAKLPKAVPVVSINFQGTFPETLLTATVLTAQIVGIIGKVRGIDPGRPGVPAFGAQLYRMSAPKRSIGAEQVLAPYRASAIERKARSSIAALHANGSLERWIASLDAFEMQIRVACFGAIVLDYDGTVVDTAARTKPARPEIRKELSRLLKGGVRIGIATGRGTSIRTSLVALFARKYWPQIIVGYHNGTAIHMLGEEPQLSEPPHSPEVHRALEALNQSNSGQFNRIRPQRNQITVYPDSSTSETELWFRVNEILMRVGLSSMRVVRSSHSVDILTSNASKLHVVKELERLSKLAVLVIGDRGCPPGNDHELLSSDFALSVDEVSFDPTTCWNLAAPGEKGSNVLLSYLRNLAFKGRGTFRYEAP